MIAPSPRRRRDPGAAISEGARETADPGGGVGDPTAHRRARPRLSLTAGLLLAALAAWRIVASAIGPAAPTSVAALLDDPGAATRLASGARGAEATSAASAASATRARDLLAREPLAHEAYVVLALAAERDAQAATLMRIAAAWWPRDIVAQTWLLGRSLRSGDDAEAMARLDAVARGRPETLDALTAAISPALNDPTALAAAVDLLASDPPWRTRFIDIAVRLWKEPAGLVALMDRLQARPGALNTVELRPFLISLLQAGDVDRAYLTWLRSLPEGRLAEVGYLYNGNFAYPVSNLAFDWSLPPVPGATAAVSGEADRVLTVGFLGGSVPLPPVLHDLMLAPGSYRLTGRASTDRLRAERGVRWRVACLESSDDALAASAPLAGTTPWRDVALDFVVPEQNCRVQVLSLDLDGRTAAERRASGVAAFSALNVEAR